MGLRRRAEEVNKNITDLRTSIDMVRDLPLEFRVMRTRVEALETRNTTIEELTATKNEMNTVLMAHAEKLAMFDAYLPQLEKLSYIIEKMDKMTELADTLSEMSEKTIAAEGSIKKFEEILAAQTARVASMKGDLAELEKAVANAAN